MIGTANANTVEHSSHKNEFKLLGSLSAIQFMMHRVVVEFTRNRAMLQR